MDFYLCFADKETGSSKVLCSRSYCLVLEWRSVWLTLSPTTLVEVEGWPLCICWGLAFWLMLPWRNKWPNDLQELLLLPVINHQHLQQQKQLSQSKFPYTQPERNANVLPWVFFCLANSIPHPNKQNCQSEDQSRGVQMIGSLDLGTVKVILPD